MTAQSLRTLRIFVAHASDCLTDHLPHGDGLVAEGFIRQLAHRHHRIHVAVDTVALRRPMPSNVTLHQIAKVAAFAPGSRLGFMLGVRRLFRSLRREGPFDVVHQFNPVFTGVSLAMLGLHDAIVLGPFVPHWPTTAGVPQAQSWGATLARDWISRVQQRRAGALLISTPAALSRVKGKPTAASPLIFEVPHGIDVTAFPARTVLPATPSILFLANMWRRKGIFTLLKAFEQVRRELPTAMLTVAGRGEDEQLVRQAVETHPEREAIVLTGNVPRAAIPDLLKSHSLYCLPSDGEPFGMTILEAMSCGLPVVTSNLGGPPHLVGALGGRLVRPDDAGALAVALIEVLSSPDLQRSMGMHNRSVAEKRFAWPSVIDALEDAYGSLLDRKQLPRRRVDARSAAIEVPPPHTLSCRS